MQDIKAQTTRGVLLDGTLFECVNSGMCKCGSASIQDTNALTQSRTNTLLIAVTGIHGNFYSNPFYYTVGDTLTASGYDFLYAQTCDAFGTIRTPNTHTGQTELIGSWNERFADAEEDVRAWVDWAAQRGYRHIILAGHSLGANKVIYYLSQCSPARGELSEVDHNLPQCSPARGELSEGLRGGSDPRVEHFLLLSPANLDYMTSGVTAAERDYVRCIYEAGRGVGMLPFPLMGWVECTVATAYDWLHSGILNNVHTRPDGDFSQLERITHTGALLIGTYDNFTDGDPAGFLRLINSHLPTAAKNRLIFIERTGHTYQQKHQELADDILKLLNDWNI